MSSAPSETTCGIPARPAASSLSGPAESTPPTSSSASSVVVRSRTPLRKLDSTSASMDCPPVPVAWKTSTSYPSRSRVPRARVTEGVVTPNIVAATSGRLSPAASPARAFAIPAAAPAALLRIRAEIRLIPAMSTTEYIIVTSTAPTYGRVSPEATVETISFGTPTGSCRIAWVTIEEPPEPPSPSTASRRPSPYSCFTTSAAPAPIAVTAPPRSPAAASCATAAPPARATSSRETSGSTCGSLTPASTSTTSTPCSRTRSRRNAYSLPFVSSVPTRTTVGTSGFRGERLDAQVAPLRLRVGGQHRGRGLGEDPARNHDELAFCDRRRHAEVLLDQQDREALLRERPERLDQVLDDRRREPLGRLVHDQQPRVRQQRPADREH